ncbi:MAG: J domain-containing protein, partial [Candidatus Micrarchaeia archaeon]
QAFKGFARKFSFEYDAGYAHYFSVLGLKPTGDKAAIRDAYRAIIKRYHPDVNKNLLSEEITKEANEAYRFLSNYSMHSEGESLRRESKSALMDALSSEYERLLEKDYDNLKRLLGGGSVERWYYDQEVGRFLDWNKRSSIAVNNAIGGFMDLGKKFHNLTSTGKGLLKHEKDERRAKTIRSGIAEAEYLYDRYMRIKKLVERDVLRDFYSSTRRNSEEVRKRWKADAK